MIVAGTGSNACYIEKLENVEMAEGNEPGPDEVRTHITELTFVWGIHSKWANLSQ